jgi:uncharacterized membrane protein
VGGYRIVASGPLFEIDGGGPLLLNLNESGLVAGNDEEGNPFVWDPTGKVRHLSHLPGDDSSEAKGINGRGQAVGYSAREVLREDDLVGIKRAVLWEPDGSVRELDVLPGEDDPEAVAINDRGQVIGRSGRTAVLWQPDGSIKDLGSLPGAEWTSPIAINDLGQVVGQSGERAVLWEPDGTLRDLGDLPGAESSSAVAINDRGQVLLSSVYADGWGSSFLWDPVTGPQGLVDRGGDISAVALNEKGQVAGTSVADGLRRAFVWDANTGMHELDVGGDLSVAVDINDLGQVVGWQATQYNPEGADPEFTGSAFLWDPDRGPINLAALWEGPSGAWAINNHGDVAGWRDSDFNDPQTIIVWSPAS